MSKDLYIFLGFLGLLFLSIYVYSIAEKRGWEEDWTCSKMVFYDQRSAEVGNGCVLENCYVLETKENAQVDECICVLNNETVRRICVEQLRWRKYNFNSSSIADYQRGGL